MRLTPSLVLFVSLLLMLLGACSSAESKPDFDTPPDPAKYRKHVEEALGQEDVLSQHDREMGASIYRTREDLELYTGWYKSTRGDGAVRLTRIEDGLAQGASITWYGDGSPMDSGWMLDGKRHGAYTFWNRERKPVHKRYEHGEVIGK